MRELERDSSSETPACARLAIVGRGRLGTALAGALTEAGYPILGPLGRGAEVTGADAALLCVPDQEIAAVVPHVPAGVIVGHCSGASGLALFGDREAFSLHPLMTVTEAGASFSGAGAAIAGNTVRAFELAHELARRLGMVPVEIDDADRAAYHAAASMASNFLVTLESAAERLAGTVGLERALLVPLVRASVENWAELGGERALTGPIVRGDSATVLAQRGAIAERMPDLLGLFDALASTTRTLAATPTEVAVR